MFPLPMPSRHRWIRIWLFGWNGLGRCSVNPSMGCSSKRQFSSQEFFSWRSSGIMDLAQGRLDAKILSLRLLWRRWWSSSAELNGDTLQFTARKSIRSNDERCQNCPESQDEISSGDFDFFSSSIRIRRLQAIMRAFSCVLNMSIWAIRD